MKDSHKLLDKVGNNRTKEIVVGSLNSDRCSVYLLTGPIDSGISSLAKIMASIVVGVENPEMLESHPDVMFFDNVLDSFDDENGENQWKESASKLINFVHLSPVAGIRKVIVIENVERLSRGALNTLLKTLEEPSPSSVMIITVSSAQNVLPTIKSRAQIIRLNYVSDEKITSQISNKDNADVIVKLAHGSLERANQLVNDKDFLKIELDKYASYQLMLTGKLPEKFKWITKMTDRDEASKMLRLWLHLARFEMIQDLNQDKLDKVLVVEKITSALKSLEVNGNVRITLENLAIALG